MPKYLVVVESPAKAKTINKFLGRNYVVKASFGHVRDLPKSEFGVDVEHDFAPKYVRLKESSKAIAALKEAAKGVEEIMLATDPDREGEAIGWHVAELLAEFHKPVCRIVFNEITKQRILESVAKPRPIDVNLVDAQQARRVLDRIVGYKMSPFLQWSVRRGLSAGRVQSVAVRMVCERESEIRAFVAVEYWSIDALLSPSEETTFTAHVSKFKGEKLEMSNEGDANTVLAALEKADFRVADIERKEVRRRPWPPFITSTLQQEASRKLNYAPRRTMVIAQQLYEGIEVGQEGSVGLITYMRTDSTRLAGEAIDEVREFIGRVYGPAMLPAKPNVYKTKKDAQDAHEAIRPTLAGRTPESLAPYLNEEQLKLYTLIWKRFVACQMAPAVLDQTTIVVTAGDYELRATGSIMKFAGFTILYEESNEDKDKDPDAGPLLPDVKEGQPLDLRELKPEQHFTKPPPRFTEATLIRAMEENGIGRPSTYAPTINTIMERGYVVREKGRLQPTELGDQTNGVLVRCFPDILAIAFTAGMEDDLDHVEEGRRRWQDLMRDFYGAFDKDLHDAQRNMIREATGEDARCPKCGEALELIESFWGPYLRCAKHPDCDGRVTLRKKSEAIPTDEVCELCGAPMVIRAGRFGRFMSCSTYPKCKTTHNVDDEGKKIIAPPKEAPVRTEEKCPQCGKGVLLIRKTRQGEPFYGCEKYPKCKFTRPMELNMKCPKEGCTGDLQEKRAKGRRFIGCDKYPDCDFAISGKVDKATACSACGHPWTTVTASRAQGPQRRCPNPACGHIESAGVVEPGGEPGGESGGEE